MVKNNKSKINDEILFLSAYLQPKIWGSNKIKKYGIKLPNEPIGEAWVISGYKNKSSVVLNGKYKGIQLHDLYNKHKELFGNYKAKQYPLLAKILDCNDSLSVQVHPFEKYARAHFNEPAKNECWYFLDTKNNANIIYGHNAKTLKEFKEMVLNNKWKKLLKTKKVKKGDLVYVPAGTIHALNKGLLVYELQQSSDVTFRLYDYDRQKTDPSRKLHINESLVNTKVPFTKPKYISNKNCLIKTDAFEMYKISNSQGSKTYTYKNAKWLQCFVTKGSGTIKEFNQKIKVGQSFLIVGPNLKKITISGKIEMLVSFAN